MNRNGIPGGVKLGGGGVSCLYAKRATVLEMSFLERRNRGARNCETNKCLFIRVRRRFLIYSRACLECAFLRILLLLSLDFLNFKRPIVSNELIFNPCEK